MQSELAIHDNSNNTGTITGAILEMRKGGCAHEAPEQNLINIHLITSLSSLLSWRTGFVLR